jgi:predicted nucleotidyltransferase
VDVCELKGKDMRISDEQVKVLKERLHTLSAQAKLYLFGSRVDDEKRGGDIDLLIVDPSLTKKDLRTLRIDFFQHFGEQKLDIVLDNGKFENPFSKYIFQKAILL